ncbi:response regulator transcription factor [Cytophagaceae bacterium AH-315-L13]|nr:response regulator transcription factor [Cytophagaceae bacterium AH-315-L13]
MDKLTAILVEDEEASRITLRNYLQKYCPTIELLGEATNINEGFDLIKKQKPKIVFLDVEMPYGNAFDLLEKFESLDFEIIFVTAFSKYALEALNLSASHYLLKPVNIDQLEEAVDKVSQQIKLKSNFKTSNILLENLAIENKQLKKMVLPMLDGFEVVILKNIVRCDANDNLTDLYLSDGTRRTVCRTLKFYENVLSDYDFVRVHKSHIININYVKEYKKGKGGEVILTTGDVVRVSPTRKSEFLKKFL